MLGNTSVWMNNALFPINIISFSYSSIQKSNVLCEILDHIRLSSLPLLLVK